MNMRILWGIGRACAALAVIFFAVPTFSQDQESSFADNEIKSAQAAAGAALQHGPRDIVLAGQAVLKLPDSYGFIPQAEAARLMRAMGNQTSNDFLGLIVGDRLKGVVAVRFEKSGYVKDEDAKDWDADGLLDNIKAGTAENNKERAARGLPELEVIGWIEKPLYEVATHRLVWSIEARDKGQSGDPGINYNTYLLGREGYLSLNLVTDLAVINTEKPMAHELLASVAFNPDKRYEDFNPSTDHIAEYGLAALVGGIAVKKLGLLALAGAFMLKTWKLTLLAAVGVGAGIKKWLGRGKTDTAV